MCWEINPISNKELSPKQTTSSHKNVSTWRCPPEISSGGILRLWTNKLLHFFINGSESIFFDNYFVWDPRLSDLLSCREKHIIWKGVCVISGGGKNPITMYLNCPLTTALFSSNGVQTLLSDLLDGPKNSLAFIGSPLCGGTRVKDKAVISYRGVGFEVSPQDVCKSKQNVSRFVLCVFLWLQSFVSSTFWGRKFFAEWFFQNIPDFETIDLNKHYHQFIQKKSNRS